MITLWMEMTEVVSATLLEGVLKALLPGTDGLSIPEPCGPCSESVPSKCHGDMHGSTPALPYPCAPVVWSPVIAGQWGRKAQGWQSIP